MKRHMSDIYLPNDAVNEILLRLPAKSLGRCKCVCKTWNNLLRNPNFITDHLHHPRNPTRLFSVFRDRRSRDDSDYVFTLFNNESLSPRQDINCPIKPKHINVIRGPVNGLYYMSYYSRLCHQALWNPSTSEFRELPSPPFSEQLEESSCYDEYFGFGSIGEDIKVINITISVRGANSRYAVIELYSLNDDSWKEIQYDSVRFRYIAEGDPFQLTHFNGVYYWIIAYGHDIILLFDMKNEEFREVNPPPLGLKSYVRGICVRDNSSIVLFVNRSLYPGESVDLWEMKGEGEWLKLMSFDPSSTYARLDPYTFRPWFWKKDEILMNTEDKKVVLYNVNSNEIRDFGIDRSKKRFLLKYKESLTSVGKTRASNFA